MSVTTVRHRVAASGTEDLEVAVLDSGSVQLSGGFASRGRLSPPYIGTYSIKDLLAALEPGALEPGTVRERIIASLLKIVESGTDDYVRVQAATTLKEII